MPGFSETRYNERKCFRRGGHHLKHVGQTGITDVDDTQDLSQVTQTCRTTRHPFVRHRSHFQSRWLVIGEW